MKKILVILTGCLMLMSGLNGEAVRKEKVDTILEMIKKRDAKMLEQYKEKNKNTILKTADEIINLHLKASGGREAWENIDTMKIISEINNSRGQTMKLVRLYKRPGFFKQYIMGTENAFVYDGSKVWKVRGGKWKESKNSAYSRMSSIDDFFLNYREKGIKMNFIGLEMLASIPAYHIKRSYPDGYSESLFFSASSGLLTEKLTPYPLGNETYLSFWDFRKTGNVLIPYVSIRSTGGFGPPHGSVIKKIEINIPVEDSEFQNPN